MHQNQKSLEDIRKYDLKFEHIRNQNPLKIEQWKSNSKGIKCKTQNRAMRIRCKTQNRAVGIRCKTQLSNGNHMQNTIKQSESNSDEWKCSMKIRTNRKDTGVKKWGGESKKILQKLKQWKPNSIFLKGRTKTTEEIEKFFC